MPASITLSRGQFWAVLGTLATGLLAIIGVPIGIVYNGLAGGIARVDGRIEGLQNSYNQAVGAAADVKHVLTLEKTILETYKLATKTDAFILDTHQLASKTDAAFALQAGQLSRLASGMDQLTGKGGRIDQLAAAVEAQKSQLGQIQQRVDRIDTNLQRAPWILR
jgi:hypothetical protein